MQAMLCRYVNDGVRVCTKWDLEIGRRDAGIMLGVSWRGKSGGAQ